MAKFNELDLVVIRETKEVGYVDYVGTEYIYGVVTYTTYKNPYMRYENGRQLYDESELRKATRKEISKKLVEVLGDNWSGGLDNDDWDD